VLINSLHKQCFVSRTLFDFVLFLGWKSSSTRYVV